MSSDMESIQNLIKHTDTAYKEWLNEPSSTDKEFEYERQKKRLDNAYFQYKNQLRDSNT